MQKVAFGILLLAIIGIGVWFSLDIGPKSDPAAPSKVKDDPSNTPTQVKPEKTESRKQSRHYAKPEKIPPRWDNFYAQSQMERLNRVTEYMDDTNLSPDILEFFKTEIYNRDHWDVTRNNMANALVWARTVDGRHPAPDLHEDFIKMLEDKDEDPVWRDYCLQFLSEFLPHSSDPDRIKDVILTYSMGTDGIAGTASVHLALQEQYGGMKLDESFNAQLADQLENPEVIDETKLSIIAVMGKRKDFRRLPLIRKYAGQDENANLKRTAIGAIGIIGASPETRDAITEEDRQLVKAALSHKNGAVVLAAKAALKRLEQD